ncbi:hypothetical protein SLE2022_034400 [Rubroshorea leprosula]
MALFRKFFYRKPPDGVLEISERVYVFDCCFTTDILEGEEYKVYLRGILGQLRDHFPDACYMVFNFREREHQSQIANILGDYDMTVIDYPCQYEGCPLLPMKMILHFLRSSESWLTLAQQNLILMYCEQGGWPVLAFMLAALMIYRKQFMGEQKTLGMIYKQARHELLQLMSPLDPLPSQLRYLQYVSRRNLESEWPPLDRPLTLDCIIIRCIPNMDGEGGCRPIFRIYGQNPFMANERTPRILFSTPKNSKLVRHYKQADCEQVKIGIHCHIQGDVVLECISLDSDQKRESMMFRVMFNAAFIRSNILILNRDEIDISWNAKDQFPKEFRAEVIFSDMDAPTSIISFDKLGKENKDGLFEEAFDNVQEFLCNVDWVDQKTDIANVLHHISVSNMLQENFEMISPRSAGRANFSLESALEKVKGISKLKALEVASPTFVSLVKQSSPSFRQSVSANSIKMTIECQDEVTPDQPARPLLYTKPSMGSHSIERKAEAPELHVTLEQPTESKSSFKPSSDANEIKRNIEPQELQVALQWSPQSKIISQQVSHASISVPVSYCSSLQGSPVPISRYHSAPSALGITALLQDHAASRSEEDIHAVTSPLSSSASTSPLTMNISKPLQQSHLSSQPPPPPRPCTQSSNEASIVKDASATEPPPPPPRVTTIASYAQHTGIVSLVRDQSSSVLSPPALSPPVSSSSAIQTSHSASLSPPPPPSLTVKNSFQRPLSPPPSPPPSKSSLVYNSFSAPPPPPPPPAMASSTTCSISSPLQVGVPPPPPLPHICSASVSSPASVSSAPPPPASHVSRGSLSNNLSHVAPVLPPPAPCANGLSRAGSVSQQSHSGSNGNIPPIPGPPSGRGLSRTGLKSQAQPRRANLKPYHWLKLTRATQGSLWAEAQKPEEASKTPQFDMSELESLFSAAAPNSDDGSKGGKSRRASGPKSEKVQLIELRRAYNCEIMLTKVKIPLPDLMSSVLALDDSALDVDQVENLIKFTPTKEEMELLKGYNGDKENLGKCEQFFLELMKVPRVESKLRVFSFKIQFCSEVSDLRNSLNIVNSAAEEVRHSVKLKRIMQTILSLGNALNHGTARGSAIGFRLDSLLKLTDTRARNKKMTLMHYLCKVLAEKLPELLDFPKDLVSLEAATKIQLKYLAEEMQAISKGLEKVGQELTASENDGLVSDTFCRTLKGFLSFAEGEVKSLASLYSSVGRNADALALYFGEDPARCPFEQVVSTLLNFVRMFVRAHNENCKQLEFEKRKAQKGTENEMLNMNSQSEGSEWLMQSTIKSVNGQ